MRSWLLPLAVSLIPTAVAVPAMAQTSVTGSDITVTGENRIVCRRVTRTATRMRTGRICRTQAQWAREGGSRVPDPNDPNATIDGVDNTLAVLGANEASTGDSGGFTSGHETPLGPR